MNKISEKYAYYSSLTNGKCPNTALDINTQKNITEKACLCMFKLVLRPLLFLSRQGRTRALSSECKLTMQKVFESYLTCNYVKYPIC